jgi:hypothetical protein
MLTPQVEHSFRGVVDRTQAIVEKLGRLTEEANANSERRTHLQQQDASAEGKEQASKEFDAYTAELHRIVSERKTLSRELRPGLLRELWQVIPGLASSHPSLSWILPRFSELLSNLPEETDKVPELDNFVFALRAFLHEAERSVALLKNEPAPDSNLSPQDRLIRNMIGIERIRILSNPSIRRECYDELKKHQDLRHLTEAALRSALNRIRKADGLPSSAELSNK